VSKRHPTIRERLNWLRPSTKRLAFMMGVTERIGERWYPQEVWKAVRPQWKSPFWAGVYPLLAELEAAGVLEAGWEELPEGSGRTHPRRWYRLPVETSS
jgi:hypothetical protein